MFAKIIDNKIVKYPYTSYDMLMDNPNTSFPDVLTEDIKKQFGIVDVLKGSPPIIAPGYKIQEKEPALKQGIWVQEWEVLPLSEQDKEEKAKELRKKRNELLNKSDWTQLPDNELSDEERLKWQQYRKELRRIPEHSKFPWDVKFPNPPVKE